MHGLCSGLVDNDRSPARRFDMGWLRSDRFVATVRCDDYGLQPFTGHLTKPAMSIHRKPQQRRDPADDADAARDPMRMP
jgi:hypothetical protein